MAGLALPAGAAVALMIASTGAAIATSTLITSKSTTPAMGAPATGQTAVHSQSAMSVATDQSSAINPDLTRSSRLNRSEQALAAARHSQVLAHAADRATRAAASAKAARVTASARAARSAARAAHKTFAARAVKAKKTARAAKAKHLAYTRSWRLPITNPVVTSGFGYRWGRLHAGEDFAVKTGTNLTSMSTGTVIFAGTQGAYGKLVKIRYWNGTVSYFGHMSSIGVKAGKTLKPGQVVGQSGNTGRSTGPHLHLEIHPNGGAAVDPLPWLAKRNIVL